MSSTRDQAGCASSIGMPPMHGVLQSYIDGYSEYKVNVRFNLSFPDGVRLGSDGLPHKCILVFGPNAFPAIYGPDGTFIERFRMEWPHFDINYIRLSKEEELITGGLQMVFWVDRRYRHGPIGIQFTEADLLHGMRRWAQFRTMKNGNRYPESQRKFSSTTCLRDAPSTSHDKDLQDNKLTVRFLVLSHVHRRIPSNPSS